MDNRTGKIYEFGADELMPKHVTELSPKEFAAIKDIKVEHRPEELAWLRFKEQNNIWETSPKEAFLAGYRQSKADNL